MRGEGFIGRSFHPDGGEPPRDEHIHAVGPRRNLRFHRRFVGPVFLVGGALLDPKFEDGLVARGKFLVRIRRRHDLVFLLRVDPEDQLTLGRLAGHERLRRERLRALIEPELAFAV